jgi:hypothetical protein
MFKWFKKIFMQTENKNNIEQTIEKSIMQTENKQTIKKKFEVEIYDKISVGEPPYESIQLQKVFYEKPVIIEASSKNDLQDFAEKLKLCNQTFKIVRVIDEQHEQHKQEISVQHIHTNLDISEDQYNNTNTTSSINDVSVPEKEEYCKVSKPKYYKIGNFEIKNDNGKIYHKQWLKLTDEEMTNFRVVSNKTNAIVNLKDKSIEMKRWVLVENSEDTTSNLEKEISYE